MKKLFVFTAMLEMVTGVLLVVCPSVPSSLLLGLPLDTAAGLVIARIAGAAVFSLGTACWFARDQAQSPAVSGLVSAMFVYNFGSAAILGCAGIVLGLHSFLLWPAVGLHTGLAFWCMACVGFWRKNI